MTRSRKLDLIAEARTHLSPSVATAAALVIHRLKQHPVAPDAVVWHATADVLDAQGYHEDAAAMRGARHTECNGSLVASLLAESEHYAGSEVVACGP